MKPRTVVKIGGSLYDLPDFGPRLDRWLRQHGGERLLLVPGGGRTADVVREFHRTHGVSEERCHWLALRALSLNAHFLEGLLAGAIVVEDLRDCPAAWASGRTPVLDLYPFTLADEGRPGCLVHDWTVTSDALAARVAVLSGARTLVLLKSVTIPAEMSWEEAGRQGHVDRAFAGVVREGHGLEVRAINFRTIAPCEL